jgi:hypothetical protein
LLFLHSGSDRILALDGKGRVIRETGAIPGLNPGGGNFGPYEFRKPRGLRFGSDGMLYCVAQDEVVAFDFVTGKSLGPVVELRGLNGQAVTSMDREEKDGGIGNSRAVRA